MTRNTRWTSGVLATCAVAAVATADPASAAERLARRPNIKLPHLEVPQEGDWVMNQSRTNFRSVFLFTSDGGVSVTLNSIKSRSGSGSPVHNTSVSYCVREGDDSFTCDSTGPEAVTATDDRFQFSANGVFVDIEVAGEPSQGTNVDVDTHPDGSWETTKEQSSYRSGTVTVELPSGTAIEGNGTYTIGTRDARNVTPRE